MKHNHLERDFAEDLVRISQSIFSELSSIRESIDGSYSGPVGVKSAAKHLEVSPQKIYHEVEHGDIPHYQESPNSKIYFFKEELDKWVREKKRISKKEILEEADNLKIGSHGGK